MPDRRRPFRDRYGAGARHLLLMLICFAVTGWVVVRLATQASAGLMAIWFVGAVIVHDLVLFPVYSTADRALQAGVPTVRALNHIRVPALAAGLLFLVYLPDILGLDTATYRRATGLDRYPYLGRWLALTGAMFLISAVWYALRATGRRAA